MTLLAENPETKWLSASLMAAGSRIARALPWVLIAIATPLHFINLNLPLWLDEAWTGEIAAQTTIGGVLQQCLYDVNAPLYYLLAHFCAMIFGISTIGLRLPTAILLASVGLVAAVLKSPLRTDTKMFWAATLALWVPGLEHAHNARCYGLLLFLATLNTVFYARLIVSPRRREACIWAAISVLMMLTHYHAMLLVGAQILILIAWHKKKSLTLWPALLLFLPFPLWMALHIRTILLYLNPQNAWYPLVHVEQLPLVFRFLFNSNDVMLLAAAGFLFATLHRLKERPEAEQAQTQRSFDPLWLVFFAALLPVLMILAASLVRPSFSIRYLFPFMPGILLGLALTSQKTKSYLPFLPPLLLLIFAVPTAVWAVNQINAEGNPYSFERASEALIGAKVKNLVFFWDNPNSKIVNPRQLAAVGGFFFERAGVPVDVTALAQQTGQDPNLRLIDTAQKHNAAILWIYQNDIPGTQADTYPVAIEAHDPSYKCHDFGDSRYGIIACRKRNDSD